MVGSDYFMWVDEPALGISSTFPEDSNYGLVNEKDEPWPELTQTATRVNGQVYDLHQAGMADVAVGEVRVSEQGYSTDLLNHGRRAVTAEVRTVVDGAEKRQTVELPADGREKLKGEMAWRPGGHLIVVQVDPDRKLSQVSRADDRAVRCFYTRGLKAPTVAPKGTLCIPLVVRNPSDAAVKDMPLSRLLADLADVKWEQIDWSQVYVNRASDGQMVTCQIDPTRQALNGESELSFAVDKLPPRACETFVVSVLPVPQERREPPPAVTVDTGDPLTVRSGELVLSRAPGSGNVLDEIALGGVPLGSYNPLVWQFPGQNQWVRTNRDALVDASFGAVRACLRVTAEYQPDGGGGVITTVDDAGKQAPAEGTPVPFRVTHEVSVYPQRPWFHARFVSIENLGDRPLQVNGYFFYLNSHLGGSAEGDRPATPDVPNYYGGGQGAWRDAQAGLVFGAEPWPNSDLKVNFFLDEGGTQHPDARKQFDTPIVLKPGEAYTEPDAPLLTVYGARNEGSPWRAVQQTLEAWANVVVEVKGAEKR